MPVVGPIVKITSDADHEYVQHKYLWIKEGTRRFSKKEGLPPLPYFVAKSYSRATWNTLAAKNLNSLYATKASADYSHVYDKLFRKISQKAEMAMNLYEMKKTQTMVTQRVQQLVKAVKAARRFDPFEVMNALGVSVTHKKRAVFTERWRRHPGSAADLWMEANFGWFPILGDLAQVFRIFHRKFGLDVKASVKYVGYPSWDDRGFDAQNDPTGSFYSGQFSYGNYAGCRFLVTSPNVYLQNQLGLVNPLSVIWDAVPFSYVLDWLGKYGTYWRSLTDQVGLDIFDAYHGWFTSGAGISYNAAHHHLGTVPYFCVGGGRVNTLPARPGLFDRTRVPNLDPWLVVTSLSLLTQQMRGMDNWHYVSHKTRALK